MQQRFELFDGPFDGLHIVSDLPPSKQLRSLAIEFYDEDDEDCYQNDPMNTKSAKYDLTDICENKAQFAGAITLATASSLFETFCKRFAGMKISRSRSTGTSSGGAK